MTGERRVLTAAVVGLTLLLAACGSSATTTQAAPRSNPYFDAAFSVRTNPYTFGQDPSWTSDGRVLSNEKDRSGMEQVYVSHLDGSAVDCLTCGEPGPNGFPQERAQGDWILFCSWRGQAVTFGAPCLGGVGTDLYAMRPDGSHVTRLTVPGSTFEPGGVPYDNYHPYWSPDGRRVAWTHLDYLSGTRGGTQWTMLVADFTQTSDGTPRLTNVVVVGPSGNHAYETQAWAPDGRGFLYTTFTSAGDETAGWLNTELDFMRLSGDGASPAHPQVTRLTDGNPGWDEQAVFTPDAKDVIWMSSRGSPSWYQTVVTAARQTGYEPPLQNEVAGPMFVLTILDPAFRTDLYELDLSNHAIRRLTSLNRIVPEFVFDPGGTKLLWTAGDHSNTFIGSFGLPSKPVRVGTPVQPVASWRDAPRHGNASPPAPTAPSTRPALNAANLPSAVTGGLALLETQLTTLAHRLQGLPQGGSCCRSPSS